MQLPRGRIQHLWMTLRSGSVLGRLGWCLLASMCMWGAMGSWTPPFNFHVGDMPLRGIAARQSFSVEDPNETQKRQRQAESLMLCVYQHDKQPLINLRQALKGSVFRLNGAASFEALTPEERSDWQGFLTMASSPAEQNSEQLYNDFRDALAEDKELAKFEKGVQTAFSSFERDGLLERLSHDFENGSQSAILVHDFGNEATTHRVEVDDVRIGKAVTQLRPKLEREFIAVGLPEKHCGTLAQLVSTWLQAKKLPETLSLNGKATDDARQAAVSSVETALREYRPGDVLVAGNAPLRASDIELLQAEYNALRMAAGRWEVLRYSLGSLGMYVALHVLCGAYIFVHHPRILSENRRLRTLLGAVVVTVTLCAFDNRLEWRGAIIPLLLFGATVAIAYQRELALLLSAAVALIVTLSLGQTLADFVVLVATTSAAILLLGRVRSRTKPIYVGLGAGAVAALTTLGVSTIVGRTLGWYGGGFAPLTELNEWIQHSIIMRQILGAIWHGVCAILAGILLTGLLPFIEKLFDVQTDISLLELGDAAHPLLQELVRRAPGTYNHSITVASIAEAAAEAIGAHGLLVRVGAYFHDIGKIFKPDYFTENQRNSENRHDSLVPAMSTLVIVAHVKDGADLAHRHGLPRTIIDFIEQHHGTMLVEYFYHQATRRQEENPDAVAVDETSFRYPGPKPQTKEAAVLMMADAAESASRSLVDPAPARIANLVNELAKKRLLDGQFDECGLTLQELNEIEESLVKSLTAVYHSRVKYPSQQTA
jgi:putative nucleotidyltransferase with HDIG domain